MRRSDHIIASVGFVSGFNAAWASLRYRAGSAAEIVAVGFRDCLRDLIDHDRGSTGRLIRHGSTQAGIRTAGFQSPRAIQIAELLIVTGQPMPPQVALPATAPA